MSPHPSPGPRSQPPGLAPRYDVALSSERLDMVPATDAEAGARVFTRPQAARFVGAASSSEAVWLSLATMIGHWHLRGYGHFVVRRKDTGAAIGLVGPWFPRGWPEPELSWHLVEGHEGQGFATEAAATLRDWLLYTQGWDTLVALIEDANAASISLAKRLGAKPEALVQTQMGEALRIWRFAKAEAVEP